MRCCLLILVAGLAASPASSQATAGPDQNAVEERKSDFDYLLGEWRFTSEHAEWGRADGYWTAVRLSSGAGMHILDEYRVVGEDDETLYLSTTLRAFNASAGVWEIVSAEGGRGLKDTGTARKVGDEMHIEQRFGVGGGSPELWRIRYHDIRPDRFSWIADVSLDEGATWQRGHLRIEAQRIGPPRPVVPLAPPKRGDR